MRVEVRQNELMNDKISIFKEQEPDNQLRSVSEIEFSCIEKYSKLLLNFAVFSSFLLP